MSTVGNNRSTTGSTTNRRSMSSIPMPNLQASLSSNAALARSTSARRISTPGGADQGKRAPNDVSSNSHSLSTSNSTPIANKLTASNLSSLSSSVPRPRAAQSIVSSRRSVAGARPKAAQERPQSLYAKPAQTEPPTPATLSNDMSTSTTTPTKPRPRVTSAVSSMVATPTPSRTRVLSTPGTPSSIAKAVKATSSNSPTISLTSPSPMPTPARPSASTTSPSVSALQRTPQRSISARMSSQGTPTSAPKKSSPARSQSDSVQLVAKAKTSPQHHYGISSLSSASLFSPENSIPLVPVGPASTVPSMWTAGEDSLDGDFSMDLDMITEEENSVTLLGGDSELVPLLNQINTLHTRKITSYKRLLERAQHSSAAQLHALQAEVRMLREQLQNEGGAGGRRKAGLLIGNGNGDELDNLLDGGGYLCSNCGGPGGKGKRKYWAGWRGFESDDEDEDIDDGDGGELVAALRGLGRDASGKYVFDEQRVRKVVKRMGREARGRLIGIILDASHPGDASLQVLLLQKYLKSTYDVLGNLSPPLALRVLLHFPVTDVVLRLSLVSKKWNKIIHHYTFWRYHCYHLTRTDPVPIQSPLPPPRGPGDAGWFPLYKSLHHLQKNLAEGLAQSILFLHGHTNHVTTLTLRGRRLISGSYDESIRFWELPERGVGVGMSRAAIENDIIDGSSVEGEKGRKGGGEPKTEGVKEALKAAECKKVLKVGKVVSCVDWLIEEEVFVVGFHDVGRVHLFSSLTYTPLQQLAGHLNGIRAVALTSKNLVSAGADKALVCWDWRAGTKIVRFGQQTTVNIGVQLIAGATKEEGERVVSVTIDGVVRVFSIQRREMISQFKLSELGGTDPFLNAKLFNVGAAPNNMLQWFAAKGSQMTCATKSVILHLQWQEDSETSTPGVEVTTNGSNPNTAAKSKESLTVRSPLASSTAASLKSPTRSPSVLSLASSTTQNQNQTPTRSRTSSSFSRSTSSSSITGSASRRPSLLGSISTGPGAGSGRLSVSGRRTPSTPLSPNSRTVTPTTASSLGSLGASVLGTSTVRFGQRAAILTAPPKLVALVETPDVAVGAVDPRKKRVVTATRFSSRVGADRRIFMSIHQDKPAKSLRKKSSKLNQDDDGGEDDGEDDSDSDSDLHHIITGTKFTESGTGEKYVPYSGVDIDTNCTPVTGAWAALADAENILRSNGNGNESGLGFGKVRGLIGSLPTKFGGLAMPEKNPMSMQMSHEEVVVGCADGTIYVMNFVGYEYQKPRVFREENNEDHTADEEDEDEGSEEDQDQD